MTCGSLFSGIGGLDLGFERAGFTVRWQVEIDPFCREVLAKHWPDVPRYGDIRELTGDELEPVDCIIGGFPCQDVSSAGARVGIDGARSGLWSEFARLVGVLRPRFVIVENVPGLLIRGMGRVLGDLAALGLDAEWQVLPAAAFGAPHERGRVLLAAYARGFLERASSIFDGTNGLPRDPVWRAAEGIQSGRGWQRWLVQASAPVDGQDPHGWFRGVDDGFPNEMDRIRALGNAVVPQVAEFVARRVLEAEAHQ